ncbi:DUF5710 domain-containing protein [Burkholderia cenocepacia]|uniref:DUF5710 domain-containing protein n=1 Tax=Burkholderia cenocepacia TaxID=95486 RepID=UPI002B245622|nr:DUF5710 domain-containing protein [Burkholderia cenocepacia]MEB2558794.1 DUF5710 domain-containing protein [Burkholderia cenocepacia]
MADANKPKRERTYLDVPFKEKDAANELGAKFDRRSKKWYVPGGTDVAPFARWMPAQDAPAAQPVEEALEYGSEADFEREAARLSDLLGQPIEEAREFVRESLRSAEEKAALEARNRVQDQGGSGFDAVDAVRAAARQARHQYFAERQHLYPQSAQRPPAAGTRARRGTRQAPVRRVQPKLDDAALGRRYREMIQSIATAVTLRGGEVNETLALEHRLESIHRDAWRKSGDAADGDRAIGEQIRTSAGFAAEQLPPQAAVALSKLRDEAGLSPIEVDERAPARDVADSEPSDDERPVEPLTVAPQHRHREPERDDGIATFADVAEAFMLDEAMRERASSDEPGAPESGELTPQAQPDDETITFADVGDAAAVDNAPGEQAPSASIEPPISTPSVEQPGAAAAPDSNTATFADVADASPIDDAMRRRGLTGDAVSGVQDAARSTVGATVANESDVQPGQASNDVSMNVSVQPGAVDTQIKRTQAPARNEPDAKNAANEPDRPVLDNVSAQDLQRVRAVRDGERAAAESLLREQSKPMPKRDDEAVAIDAPAGTPAPDDADNQIDVDPSLRKPITTKDGYTIPAQVASRYMVKDGRFWKLDGMEGKPGEHPTTKPHFEDTGSRLKTQQNDRGTIADMLAVMKAKNIDSITVKGSETFRRNAWIEASLDGGIDVKGFKPKEADFALLEAAKRERDALTIKAGTSPEPAAGPKVDAKVDPSAAKPSAPAASPKPDAVPTTTATPSAPVASAATKPVVTSSGELLQHGAARYENKPNESYSYFVRYRDDAGAERTVWGVDLQRAIAESGAKVGDTVSLKNMGRTPVTVQEQVRDAAGKVIGTQPKDTIRNAWEVKRSAAPEPERAPARAQMTVAQMREQLEKSLEHAPARMRGEVMRRFDARMQAGVEVESRIARGELSRDAGAAEIDKRAGELHAAWTAPKAAPTSQPSNSPQPEQQQARGPTPSVM